MNIIRQRVVCTFKLYKDYISPTVPWKVIEKNSEICHNLSFFLLNRKCKENGSRVYIISIQSKLMPNLAPLGSAFCSIDRQ